MGSRLMVESLARGVPACIRVRDMGWSSCRSRFLNSPDTLSCRGREGKEGQEHYKVKVAIKQFKNSYSTSKNPVLRVSPK